MRTRTSAHRSAIALLVAGLLAGTAAWADDAPTSDGIPTCTHKLGTLSVKEPDNHWWYGYHLESPAELIKLYVSKSNCFTLLDRGKGLAAAQAERQLASSGEERVGSNVGKGQMIAADYVLVPDVVDHNNDAGGSHIGGLVGGLLPHGIGAAIGNISTKKKEADVVLTLTDVRSTEQVSLQQGHASSNDMGFSTFASGFGLFHTFAGVGLGSYSNTDMGKLVTKAYLDAYTKMVGDIRNMKRDAKAQSASQSVTMAKPGKLYSAPNTSANVVRDLDPGMTLYPTGEKSGIWWKVSDELGNEGWVPSPLFGLAK